VATRRENRQLRAQVGRLERRNHELEEKVARLQGALEAARRSGKRQAAPFSKGEPKRKPRCPGRRPGKEHGPSTWRPAPAPKEIDEVVDAPLPERCPDCGGEPLECRVAHQFQADVPVVRPHVTQFNVHVGRCTRCGRRLQGRHARQTSDALGAAASQVGPRALALGAELNKGLGLSFEKASRLLEVAFGLSVSRGGLCQAIARVARVARPTYRALIEKIRASPVVVPDETGWKVGGWLEWLWVFVGEDITVYAIQPGRGYAEAAAILGEDFDGTLVRDGWAPYRRFEDARHQTCLGHLLTRCRENLETAVRGTARVPRAVQRLLTAALELRDRRDADSISVHGLAVARGRLEAQMDRLLGWKPKDEENRKLLAHLRKEREALFNFLAERGIPATNWRAEQAIRPAVVTRKVCGGNRTWNGADVQQVLASVLRTCRQQQHDALEILADLLRSTEPVVAQELVAGHPA
jgi:transposase